MAAAKTGRATAAAKDKATVPNNRRGRRAADKDERLTVLTPLGSDADHRAFVVLKQLEQSYTLPDKIQVAQATQLIVAMQGAVAHIAGRLGVDEQSHGEWQRRKQQVADAATQGMDPAELTDLADDQIIAQATNGDSGDE